MEDLKNLLKACLMGSALVISILIFSVRFEGYPRSVFVMDFVLTFVLTGSMRAGIRIFLHDRKKGKGFGLRNFKPKKMGRRALIVGAGDAGEKLIREIWGNPDLDYEVVGFLDDDLGKQGRSLHGVPIRGDVTVLAEVAENCGAEEIIVAIPSATGREMRRIVTACDESRLKVRTIPGLGELLDGRVSVKTLRDVSYEDLLGRSAVNLQMESIGGYLKDKTVLVSGAGGSIGGELCRQIIKFDPARLVMLDASEPMIYGVQMERAGRRLFWRWGHPLRLPIWPGI